MVTSGGICEFFTHQYQEKTISSIFCVTLYDTSLSTKLYFMRFTACNTGISLTTHNITAVGSSKNNKGVPYLAACT